MTITIKVKDQLHREKSITAKQGTTLFSALMDGNILFPGNCGGNGTCHACTVYDYIANRYIKCCQTEVQRDMYIQLPITFQNIIHPVVVQSMRDFTAKNLGFAIDLGTTSIGLELYDLCSQELLVTHCILNPQVFCGADVISRIHYAESNNGLLKLKYLVWDSLFSAMLDMVNALDVGFGPQINQIAVAGNTTMQYLLMGYPVNSLGVYPFFAEHLDAVRIPLKEIVKTSAEFSSCILYAYPGISVFVGGDILSGACALGLGQKKAYDFLIDFGTNGELYLLNNQQGFCGATSCGPAFDAYISGGEHGTDMLSRIALLRARGVIGQDGLISERYLEDGYHFPDGVTVTMSDIRALQQAKAAIRTGIDILTAKAGISFQDCNVYLAGNFGFHLDLDSAFHLGLIPATAKERIHVVGNSALKGTGLLLFQPEQVYNQAKAMIFRTAYCDFVNEDNFQKHFVEAMILGE